MACENLCKDWLSRLGSSFIWLFGKVDSAFSQSFDFLNFRESQFWPTSTLHDATTLRSASDRLKWPDRNKPPTLTPQRDFLFHSKKCSLRKKLLHDKTQSLSRRPTTMGTRLRQNSTMIKRLAPRPCWPGFDSKRSPNIFRGTNCQYCWGQSVVLLL